MHNKTLIRSTPLPGMSRRAAARLIAAAERAAPLANAAIVKGGCARPRMRQRTVFARFLICQGITLERVAREAGIRRVYLLRISSGRAEPTTHCLSVVTAAVQRISGENVAAADVFGAATVGQSRGCIARGGQRGRGCALSQMTRWDLP
jgi:DNA-binding phage protein